MSKLVEAGGMSAQALEDHPMFDLLNEAEAHREFKRGDIVEGMVALVGSSEILIDIGGKSEGLLAPREFSKMSNAERGEIAVGDEVEVFVVNPNASDGPMLVSLSQVRIGQDWDDAEAQFEQGDSFEATIASHNKGGLIVYLGQVRGFIPVSQLDRRHAIDRERVDGSSDSPLARFAGSQIWLKIIELDRNKNRLILSEQAAMRERRKELKSKLLAELTEGSTVEGKVTSLADFGAFVDIGGADGLVHLSELSWNRVSHPSEVLSLGEDVEVKVISVDRERNRIGLSIKQLQPEPWSTIDDRYQVGEVVDVEITRLADFGAFARLENNIEGLIHVSELADEELTPETVVSPGQQLMVRIIRIDPERKRIGLSLKRAGSDFDGLGLSIDEAETEDVEADDSPGTEVAGEPAAEITTEPESEPESEPEPEPESEPEEVVEA